jgi:hypothetical protein
MVHIGTTKQAIELLKLAARSVGGRDQLLDILERRFNLKLPSRSSYSRILQTLLESNLESDFCQGFFQANNFNEAWDRYIMAQGLTLLDTVDVLRIADFLSESGNKWKYDKASRGKTIESMLLHITGEQLANCLQQMMLSGQIEPFVSQQRRAVVGPLGVTYSAESRSSTISDDLIRFIQAYFSEHHFEEFAKKMDFPLLVSQPAIQGGAITRPLAHIQLMLTHCDDSSIFNEFNAMIQQGVLEIGEVEQYWNLIATPHGVFRQGYDAEENLSHIIKQYYSEQDLEELLSSKGYGYGDPETSVREMCLSENPEQILLEVFGRKELNQIARELGLVAVEKAREIPELVKIIALRLGFALPPTLEGINAFVTELEKRRLRLEEYRITTAERDGLMSESFVIVEKILKDLASFYVCLLWPKTIEQHFEQDEKKKALNDLVRRELQIGRKEGLDRLMIGELIEVLRKLNERVGREESMRLRALKQLKRKELVPDALISMIESACNYRPYFVHDAIRGKRNLVMNTRLCQKLLNDITSFAKTLANDRIYPCVLRIHREVTDEYGRTYVEAIDDSGRSWVIRSRSWLRPEFAYYMPALSHGFVAVEPFIIEKLR